MDDEVISFGIQVCETGRKSFILDYMFEVRRQLYIGDFPDCLTNAVSNRWNTREDLWYLLRRHNDAIGTFLPSRLPCLMSEIWAKNGHNAAGSETSLMTDIAAA